MQKFRSNVTAAASQRRSTLDVCKQPDEATDGRRGQSGVGSAYMRIESLGNGNHLEAKSPRRRTDRRTDADGAVGRRRRRSRFRSRLRRRRRGGRTELVDP